ncbi:MAG: recombinase RecT [Candidatus Magnetobacterium sp. LHC-1]
MTEQKQDTTENKDVAVQQLTNSQKFTNKVLAEFKGNAGEIAVTDFQKRLIQNYFMAVDMSLKKAEQKRLKAYKPDPIPVKWENVNLEQLALDVVNIARLGLDPLQPNHIYFIPYKNNNTGKYDMTAMEGYRGKEVKAVKYGLDVPSEIIFELVYDSDYFKPLKKNHQSKIESYEFEIKNAFNRGNIIGGFAYFIYENPEKNKLMMMSLADILKRKPDKAAPEFWGGEKDVYKDGKKTGDKEPVAGWFDEMCLKTLKRAAYGSITIDSQKIDDTYQYLRLREIETADQRIEAEIDENANKEVIDVTGSSTVIEENGNTVDTDTGEIISEAPKTKKSKTNKTQEIDSDKDNPFNPGGSLAGPGF